MARQSTKKAAGSDNANGDAAPGESVDNPEATEAPKPKKPKPNIKLAGQAEPLGAGELTVGMNVIGELPDEDTQKAGWHCAFAGRLVQLFPDRFKLMLEKGN